MGVAGRRWRDHFGLQARMTASYVLVTAAAVIVVEAIAIGVIIPSFLASQDLTTRVAITAGDVAGRVAVASLSATTLSLPPDFVIGDQSASLGPGQVQDQGQGLVVPQITQSYSTSAAPSTVAILFAPDGHVLASSYPARYPVGGSIDNLLSMTKAGLVATSKGDVADAGNGSVAWSVQPVFVELTRNGGRDTNGVKNISPDAYVYVQAPVQSLTLPASLTVVQPLLQAGLVVLLLALPVGALFGLLTTRGLVRRLRRLAGTTATVAEGDFSQRLVPGAGDEVGRLEHNFNEMAERLSSAVSRERMLAEKTARQAERSRISRELHDSISQDLFSISLLAAGLEKTLPADSPVRPQVRALIETAETTNREMRALLLELRPATLEDKGLIPALEELAANYAARLGVKVETELERVHLEPAVELAALRIAQEGLANAVKHAEATSIKLALHRNNAHADITISDDGRGFEANANGAREGLGLRLMRERIAEIGGTMSVESMPGKGTVVSASMPVTTP
jgi:signal transduction histidine kinase